MSHSKQNNENQVVTLATYAAGVGRYITETGTAINSSLQNYLDAVLEEIPTNAKILEVGSGSGRDADYIEAKGFQIQRSDAVTEFVLHLQEKGDDAILFNVLNDNLFKQYDVIIATAVFLHFTQEQFSIGLKNLHQHLRPDGMIVISVKPGEGEEYSDRKMNAPRYFKYWDQESLATIVSEHDFAVERYEIIANGLWLQCIARKV